MNAIHRQMPNFWGRANNSRRVFSPILTCTSYTTMILCLLLVPAFRVSAADSLANPSCIVAQDGSGDYNGTTEQPIQEAVAAMRSGGVIHIRPGVYTIWRTIDLSGAADLVIRGEDGVTLQLPPLPRTTAAHDVPVGSREIPITDASAFRERMHARVKAPGRTDMHHGKAVVIPTFEFQIKTLSGNRLILAEPLPYAIPNGSPIVQAENIFALTAGNNIAIERLTLDGNWNAADPDFAGHVIGCAFLANGPYSYETGITGEPVRGLRIEACTIQNTRGRGIAWYAVHDSAIRNCTIQHSPDSGINIDHFCKNIKITNNTLSECSIGIELNDATRCVVRGNRIQGCSTGISLWRWCAHPYLNIENSLTNNVIMNAQHCGIHIGAQTERNLIKANHIIAEKSVGIRLQGDANTTISNRIEGYTQAALENTGQDNTIRFNRIEISAGN